MKNKKIIKEQNEAQKQKELLEKALSIGCFSDLNLDIDKEVKIIDTYFAYLNAKGKNYGKEYFITINPNIIAEKNSTDNVVTKWECPQLIDNSTQTISSPELERKKEMISKDSSNNSKETVPADETKEPTLGDAIKNAKDSLKKDKISANDCIGAINVFYRAYDRRDSNALGNDFNTIKQAVQKCAYQKNLLLNLPKIQKKLKALGTVNPYDTRVGQFRIIIENDSLGKLIKKTLVETKEKKENQLIEQKLVETRIKFIIEDLNKFEKYSRVKKVKTGFNFLRETSYLKSIGMINEDLSSIFKSIYGKSLPNTIDTISEPLFSSIFNKIGLMDDLKGKVIENIKSKSSELITNMDDCKNLSKFISDAITEELAKKLDTEKLIQSDVVNSSLMDAVNDEMFRKNLNTKLENHICELFNKFMENAKNLVVRMTSL